MKAIIDANDYVWHDNLRLLIEKGYPIEYETIGIYGLTEVIRTPKEVHLYDAQKWLRGLGISVQPMTCRGGTWDCQVTFCDDKWKDTFDDKSKWVDDNKSYECALRSGINLALKLI